MTISSEAVAILVIGGIISLLGFLLRRSIKQLDLDIQGIKVDTTTMRTAIVEEFKIVNSKIGQVDKTAAILKSRVDSIERRKFGRDD